MSWYSMYGTGATIHGIDPQPDGRVEFTSWITIFWIPILPISSWSALFAGETAPTAITDEGVCFVDMKRIPHNWKRIVKTFLSGLGITACSAGSIMYMAWRTTGRAATPIEMIIVLTLALGTVGVIIWCENRRKKQLRGHEFF